MSRPSDPISDPQRLAALRSLPLVDTPAEESFDRITRLAARLLECPASVVTLIEEDRQFFKSCVGLPEPLATLRGSPLTHSFCKFTVRAGELFVIEDARSDERVGAHPAIEEWGILSYAGIPIHTSNNQVLGTLCVVDVQPRRWTESELLTLRELAASVESEIELIASFQREREQSRMLRTVIEASPLAVIVTDSQDNVELWNDAAERIFEWSSEEVVGGRLPIVPDDQTEQHRRIQSALSAGESMRSVRGERRRRDGQIVQVNLSVAPLPRFGAQADRVLWILDDISEEHRATQDRERLFRELKNEQALLHAMVDQMPAGAIVAEMPSGKIKLVNQVATNLIGDGLPTEVNPHTLEKFRGYHADGRPYQAVEWPLLRSLLHGEVVTNELIDYERPDGQRRTLMTSSTPVTPEPGVSTAAVVTFTDITPLQEGEAARRRSEEKSKRMIESSQDCIAVLELDGRMVSISTGGKLRMELEENGDVIGRDWIQLWDTENHLEAQTAISKARDGEAVRFRCVCQTPKTNTKKWWDVIITPMRDERGEPEQLLSVAREVTDQVAAELRQKELEEKLRERADELSEMDERKNRFLALLAHELRNPLTPIGTAVDLLRYNAGDPQQVREIGGVLEDQVRQLVRLIDDLMDVSRITRGRIGLQREPLSMHDVLETSLRSVETLCHELGHELVLHSDRSKSLRVLGDYVRLSQVVTNLLNNACKYTPPGGRIVVSSEQSEDGVMISVRDNGIGIPDEHRTAIFDMFTQVESTIKDSRGGLGIGLTLVKQLVEMHGGRIRLVDAPALPGSEFVIQLPRLIHLPTPVASKPTRDAPQKRYRILVIDDVPAIAKMFTKLVTAMGHQVTAANDAASGLEHARELLPEIVFSDICMPQMDGYELARRLRNIPELDASMLVAMTGNGQPEDIQMALRAGFDKHLTKPASVQRLTEVFQEYAARCANDNAE